MAFSIEIEPDSDVAIVWCSGALGAEDAQEAASALWKTPKWTGRSAIFDFREASFDLSAADTRGVARFVLGQQPEPPPEKMAFVAERDAEFGMARMFSALREDPRTQFRVFRDFDEALRWARQRR